MTRDYSMVQIAIWTDPDFRNLSVEAQRLYFLLLTSPTLNRCGVADWRENRLAALAVDSNVESLRAAAFELGNARLIAVDPETEEALVRSFVRHDGVLKSPNVTRALVKDYASIASSKLMALVSVEVRRAFREHPEWKGASEAERITKQFPEAESNPFEMVPDWFAKEPNSNPSEEVPNGFGKGFDLGSGKGSKSVPTTSNHIYTPLPANAARGECEGREPNEPPSDSGGAGEPAAEAAQQTAKKPSKRATQLPADWAPTPRHAEIAAERGIWVSVEAEKFRDYCAATGKTYRDHDAAFRNWLRNAKPSPLPENTPQRDELAEQRRRANRDKDRAQREAWKASASPPTQEFLDLKTRFRKGN